MYPSLEIHLRTSTPPFISSHSLLMGMGAAKAGLMLGAVAISNASIAD